MSAPEALGGVGQMAGTTDTVGTTSMAAPRESISGSERAVLTRAFARIDPRSMAIAMGLVMGIGLALMTAMLLIQGGKLVGLHLNRLGYFLPFYSVSGSGVFIGLIDGGLVGFGAGYALAKLWNGYHRLFISFLVARENARETRRELQEL